MLSRKGRRKTWKFDEWKNDENCWAYVIFNKRNKKRSRRRDEEKNSRKWEDHWENEKRD